jgi:hypothetical protein
MCIYIGRKFTKRYTCKRKRVSCIERGCRGISIEKRYREKVQRDILKETEGRIDRRDDRYGIQCRAEKK